MFCCVCALYLLLFVYSWFTFASFFLFPPSHTHPYFHPCDDYDSILSNPLFSTAWPTPPCSRLPFAYAGGLLVGAAQHSSLYRARVLLRNAWEVAAGTDVECSSGRNNQLPITVVVENDLVTAWHFSWFSAMHTTHFLIVSCGRCWVYCNDSCRWMSANVFHTRKRVTRVIRVLMLGTIIFLANVDWRRHLPFSCPRPARMDPSLFSEIASCIALPHAHQIHPAVDCGPAVPSLALHQSMHRPPPRQVFPCNLFLSLWTRIDLHRRSADFSNAHLAGI